MVQATRHFHILHLHTEQVLSREEERVAEQEQFEVMQNKAVRRSHQQEALPQNSKQQKVIEASAPPSTEDKQKMVAFANALTIGAAAVVAAQASVPALSRAEMDMLKAAGLEDLSLAVSALANKSAVESERAEVAALLAKQMNLQAELFAEDRPLAELNSRVSRMLGKLSREVQKADAAIGESMRLMDLDGDGFISEKELEMAARLLREQPTADVIRDAFRQLDRDGDGKISVNEMQRAVKDMLEAGRGFPLADDRSPPSPSDGPVIQLLESRAVMSKDNEQADGVEEEERVVQTEERRERKNVEDRNNRRERVQREGSKGHEEKDERHVGSGKMEEKKKKSVEAKNQSSESEVESVDGRVDYVEAKEQKERQVGGEKTTDLEWRAEKKSMEAEGRAETKTSDSDGRSYRGGNDEGILDQMQPKSEDTDMEPNGEREEQRSRKVLVEKKGRKYSKAKRDGVREVGAQGSKGKGRNSLPQEGSEAGDFSSSATMGTSGVVS